MRSSKLSGSLLLMLVLTGCKLGPKYARPDVDLPGGFRGEAPALDTTGTPASLGDEKWAEVFKDPTLQQLIREALANNYDVRIAAQRVLEEQDVAGITRSQQFPTVGGGGSYTALGLPNSLLSGLSSGSSNGSSGGESRYYAGGITLSAAWNMDFWGQYRRQTEAARAQLLGTEWGRRMVLCTVVENVATAYFQLRTLDTELEITKRTLEARKESLQLTETLERGGAATLADVRLAEELRYTAAAAIPNLERQIGQEENSISILLGRNPGPIARDTTAMNWPLLEPIPAGIPSQLLERRPDIQQAEAKLVAANANVGVAKAQLFPQLSLSAEGGSYSSQLKSLVDSKSMFWMASGNLTQTIFDGGRLRNNVRLSEAQKQEQVVTYQRTIQQAFQNVSDALIGLQKYREYREQEAKVTAAAEDATRLARVRYNAGSTSYLEVLTNDSNYYSAQLNLAVAQEQEALSIVQLYSALGGGWQ
jgi:multidrug efflux system outer membrane protein